MSRKRPAIAFRGKAITIACTDKARSHRFYAEVLGAELLPGDGYGCPWYRLGSLTFSLLPNASEPCPVSFPTQAGTMLWLEVDDLGAAHRHLIQQGVSVVELHESESMIVTDPDGVLIEIWQVQADAASGC
jgi:catechol 2,3-dioxygenase-like lactoylglutathione lyase family enzyme